MLSFFVSFWYNLPETNMNWELIFLYVGKYNNVHWIIVCVLFLFIIFGILEKKEQKKKLLLDVVNIREKNFTGIMKGNSPFYAQFLSFLPPTVKIIFWHFNNLTAYIQYIHIGNDINRKHVSVNNRSNKIILRNAFK